jgi:hypothetical protein
MKHLRYLLILLLFSAQADDLWAIASDLEAVPFAGDNDEYLPVQGQVPSDQSSFEQRPLFDSVKSQPSDFSTVRKCWLPERSLTALFISPSLYLFMSLQI